MKKKLLRMLICLTDIFHGEFPSSDPVQIIPYIRIIILYMAIPCHLDVALPIQIDVALFALKNLIDQSDCT